MSAGLLRIAAGLIAGALSGCASSPDYRPLTPNLPAHWGEAAGSDLSVASSLSPWWTTFNDKELNSLIERAVQANLDVQLAGARVREARARREVAVSPLWPSVDAAASIKRERESQNAPGPVLALPGGQFESRTGQAENLFQAGFDASWELDLFGGRQRAIEAAGADLEASRYDQGAVTLTLLAEVARSYIALRGVQHQTAVARANLAAVQDMLSLVRARYTGGMATDRDVAGAEAQVEFTASRLPTLEASYKEALHRLSVLIGQSPSTLSDELAATSPIPEVASAPPVGLPSDLLRQRPDIQRTERQLAAATARLGMAKADLYPRFTLFGELGLASVAASDFFSRGSTYWSIGPSMVWPIFRRGEIVGTIEVRDAQQQQALILYRRAILNGLKDVEDAIASYNNEQHRRNVLANAVDANQRAVDLARGRYEGGLTDFLDVIDAQRSLFRMQDELARSETAIALDAVALYKALGGGWKAVEPSVAGAMK